MKKIKFIDLSIFLLFIFIILTFFQGYQCKYLKLSYCKIDFFENILLENGFIENLQSTFLFLAIIFLFISFKKFNHNKLIKIFLTIKVIALIYYLGEEISWGQHFFKWISPDFFLNYNNQDETNLHNISNLLDQLPRTLVMIWCGLIPIIFYYLKKKFTFRNESNLIMLPNKRLLYISIIFLIFFLPDFIVDKLSLHPGHYIDGKDIEGAIFYDIISLNFLRLSEIHELIFCFYFLIYSISFSRYQLK